MIWQLLLSLAALASNRQDAPSFQQQQQPWNAHPIQLSWDQEQSESEFVASPTGPQTQEEKIRAFSALYGHYIGGDMIFPDENFNRSGVGMTDPKYRWFGYPGKGEIPYVVDYSAEPIMSIIQTAMQKFHRQTCIRFVPRTHQRDYIRIFRGNGCWSVVGKKGGQQDLSLGEGCDYVGVVLHELAHAVGMLHEHQRSDRNRYLQIDYNNIKSGQKDKLWKNKQENEIDDLTHYDYMSVMHFGQYAFSTQPYVLKTLEAKDGTPLIDPFDKSNLAQSDVELIKKLYRC